MSAIYERLFLFFGRKSEMRSYFEGVLYMESLLQALYRGTVHPEEKIVPSDPEYRLIGRQMSLFTAKWRERLDEETFRELDEYSDLCLKAQSIHVETAFIQGFKLGANMMMEIMSGREELVPSAD